MMLASRLGAGPVGARLIARTMAAPFPSRLDQDLLDLRQRPVRFLRGAADHLGPVQAEQPAQRRLMPGPEPDDSGVIGVQPVGDHPVCHIAQAALLDHPAGPLALAVPVQQQRHYRLRVERGPPVPVGPVPAAEPA